MSKKEPIKVIISTGQGRLHLLESAKALKSIGMDVQVITGWIPSKYLPDFLINVFGKLLGRKNLASVLRKRHLNDFGSSVHTCTWSEFTIQFLFLVSKTKLLSRDFAARWGWKLFGWESKQYLKNVDIFHVRSGAGQGGAIKRAKQKDVKVIVDHSIAHPNEVYKQLLKANKGNAEDIFITPNSKFWQLVLKDCKDADIIQVNSEYVKESFVDNGFESDKIKVVPLGIRKAFWGLKNEYHTSNTVNLLFTGGFGRRKGAHLIIEICKELMNTQVDFKIDIIGSIVGDIELPNWFVKDTRIVLHGHLPQEQLFDFLKKADIYIFPSYSEGAAQSLKEAMAAGLPVIATKQSGAPIIHKENGWLIEDDNAIALFKAIMYLKQHTDLQEKLGKNATMTIKEGHTWEKYGVETSKIYYDLLNDKF